MDPSCVRLPGPTRRAGDGLSRAPLKSHRHPEMSFVTTMLLMVSVREPLHKIRMTRLPGVWTVNGRLRPARPGWRLDWFRMTIPAAGGWVTRRTLAEAALGSRSVS